MSINRENTLTDWNAGVRPKVERLNSQFPDLTWGTYGGHDPTPGRASDGMVPAYKTAAGRARGWVVAKWIQANAVELGVWYVIFDGKIWSRTRPSAGWITYNPTAAAIRKSPDSAYHRNHVHVSWYDLPAPAKYLPAYIVDPLEVSSRLVANAPTGKDDIEREPGFRVYTGVRIDTRTNAAGEKSRWLITESGYQYNLDYLVLESEYKKRPPVKETPVPTKPTDTRPTPKPGRAFTKVATLDAPGGGNWQGAMRTASNIFMVEAIERPDGSEDCIVYRYAKAGGNPLDSMTLDADKGVLLHPTGWAMSDSGVGWVTWNDTDDFDLVTFNYKAGTRIKKSQVQVMEAGPGHLQIAMDDSRNLASLRRLRKGDKANPAGYDIHTLVTKQSILDGKPTLLPGTRTLTIKRRDNRVVQGFTVALGHLYVLCGLKSKKSPFVIEKWSFASGTLIETIPLPHDEGEPEGIDASNDGGLALYFGMKTGKGDARRLTIYRTTT